MYIYIYIYVNIFVYIHVNIYRYICMRVFICIFKRICMYESILHWSQTCEFYTLYSYIYTGWRRLIGSPKLQIIFHKRANKYRSLLRKETCKLRRRRHLCPTPQTFVALRNEYTHTNIHIHKHTHTHAHTHTHTHIYTHIHTYTDAHTQNAYTYKPTI